MQIKRRALTRTKTNDSNPLPGPPLPPWELAPDDLRNQVQMRLSMLGEADRKIWRQRLLNGMAQAGLHLGAALFMLGIAASSLDDLTPCDVGKLLRYARINTPAIVTALAGPLTELLAVGKNRR